MIQSRRRFLAISAAFICASRVAAAQSWNGRAFGADISISLQGPRDVTEPALREAKRLLVEIEGLFSLYAPNSALSRLNKAGFLIAPPARFGALMDAADYAYRVTGGLFDPSVQALWQALEQGRETAQAAATLGWQRVQYSTDKIELDQGQALTFNGIAQGFATDQITAVLRTHGLEQALVNIGEYRALGGPYSLGLADPEHGQLATRRLENMAIATSSPRATLLAGKEHILHPKARPFWSTVSVETQNAARADSLSTAMVLMPFEQIVELAKTAQLRRVTLIDFNGDLRTI